MDKQISRDEVTATQYVFGPVPSRRLGRSLGLDLVPFKTCSYDCAYCQLGRTTNKTITRAEYVPTEQILREVEAALQTGPPPDYITLAGSGEPTLFRPLDKLIACLKEITQIPLVILTNGSLLWDEHVREELAGADIIMPSLDAGDDDLFQRLNRPHSEVTFERMVEGLITFRREFPGAYWLEIMLLAGLTDSPAAIQSLARLVRQIKPDRVYLNTVVRPPAESWVKPVSAQVLADAAAAIGSGCEVITEYNSPIPAQATAGAEKAVLALLRRRPCRLEDLSAGLGMHRNEVLKYLGHLLQIGKISGEITNEETYYSATRG